MVKKVLKLKNTCMLPRYILIYVTEAYELNEPPSYLTVSNFSVIKVCYNLKLCPDQSHQYMPMF